MIDYWNDLINYKQKTMKAQIEIKLDSDALKGNSSELARVLRNLAKDVEEYDIKNLGAFIGVMDVNGNGVGQFEIIEE
tara:strand:+ start:286 stop:519 length:234 start_codon:yes stop_codon:yes gene_type:complete